MCVCVCVCVQIVRLAFSSGRTYVQFGRLDVDLLYDQVRW